jgi:preprotein translocase subunit SecD
MIRIALLATAVTAALVTLVEAEDLPAGVVEFYLGESHARPGLKAMPVDGDDNDMVYLFPKPFLTGSHVASAAVIKVQGRPVIEVKLDEVGKGALVKATAGAQQDAETKVRLALVIDGKVVVAPRIYSKIEGGVAQITGSFDQEEAEAIAAKMRKSVAGKP